MKKLIISMSIIAIAISSCNKQASILSNTNASQCDLLQADATHYYNGKQVTHISEIATYNSNESAIILTDKINGSLQYYYFDNEALEINFLAQYPVLKPLYTKILQGKELREYAIANGETAHYNITGEISKAYTDYANKFKTRGNYTLYANLGGVPPALFIPAGGIAAFPLWMDNNAESFNSPAGQGIVYKNPFYGGASLGIFATAGVVNFIPAFQNVISSAL